MPKGKELKLVGADTGFFYSLKEEDQTAQAVFQDCDIVVSILTVFELRRAALKGTKPTWHQAQKFLEKFATVKPEPSPGADRKCTNTYHRYPWLQKRIFFSRFC